MRETLSCPKCHREEIIYVPSISDSHQDHLGLDVREGWWMESKLIGAFEAYICKGCGYTELYVADIAAVDVASLPGAKLLRRNNGGVYR